MSADLVIYCLERATDYRQFERLCSALMAGAGYPCLDPLGGTGDEGRDAVIREDEQGRKICFAYTVRADWRVKLGKDCKRVHEKGHEPAVFVFVCTESLSAAEKDYAHNFVTDTYGWKLDLFDLERLRVQLVGPQRHLLAQHPSIFTPPFYPQRGGESISVSRDTLLIDHVPQDHALATWLARRLTLAGFRTWCQGTAPLAGENVDDTVRILNDTRTQHYLPVISSASLVDSVFRERCTIAAVKDNFVLPCAVHAVDASRMPSRLAKVATANFAESWNVGLSGVLARMRTLGIKPSLEPDRARQIALADYIPTRVTTTKPESVFANVFPLALPNSMLVYELRSALTAMAALELRNQWAFVELAPNRLIAFTSPPPDGLRAAQGQQVLELSWRDYDEKRLGRKPMDIAKELAWRTLHVACVNKGLRFCPDRKVYYFPRLETGDWSQKIQHVDGRSTTVQLTGERTKGFGERASLFHYQLGPRFSPQYDLDGTWNVVVKIYVRVTTTSGTVFEGKEIGRRRKIVTRGWWNQQWLARLLGVVQALQTSDGCIAIGEAPRTVSMQSKPLRWECPVGLDVLSLSGVADLGEEIAQYRARDDDDDDDEELMQIDAPAATS